jgi:hypothetical protein
MLEPSGDRRGDARRLGCTHMLVNGVAEAVG